MQHLPDMDSTSPVLIAGATASGKSALAIHIAQTYGGVVVNADALQVYDRWHILSARPTHDEMAGIDHHLYGHVAPKETYSVGHWLKNITPLLAGPRPIIVGGTGLYFRALTEGLADIPATPPAVRAKADTMLREEGCAAMVSMLDAQTAAQIDCENPARVQRAWEVLHATGQGLRAWQDRTGPALVPQDQAIRLHLDLDKDVLNSRIAQRFAKMVDAGALDEVRANFDTWDWSDPSARAIGAPELMDYLKGDTSLDTAIERAIISTRQYAKRQRTWFRKRMSQWHRVTGGK